MLIKLTLHSLDIDGVFLSNGPGDPGMLTSTVGHLSSYLSQPAAKPVFGICMGHAVLSQAIGATTFKMKSGHSFSVS